MRILRSGREKADEDRVVIKSVKVRDYMVANPITVTPEMEIVQAIQVLIDNRISGVPVVDLRGQLVGMLSEQDCLKIALCSCYHSEPGGRVAGYMSHDVMTVEVDASILDMAELFVKTSYRRFPVLERQRLVGQVSRHDILRALQLLSRA